MQQKTLTDTWAVRKRSAVAPTTEPLYDSLPKIYVDDKENALQSPTSRRQAPSASRKATSNSAEFKRRKHGTGALPPAFRTLDVLNTFYQ